MALNLNQFDLNLLVAFDTLMTERGVTRAGRVLGITQAAMSNTLRRLRDRFDDPLFIKAGSRMEPTPRAMELALPISRALEHIQHVFSREAFNPEQSRQLFRIATVDCVAATFFPRLLEELSTIAPGVAVELCDPGSDRQVTMLEEGKADLALTWFPWVLPGGVRLHRLYRMRWACLSRPGHPLIGKRLDLEGFLAANHVQYYPHGMESTPVDEALMQMGRKRRVVLKLGTTSIIPFLVAREDLLAVLPERFATYLAQRMGLQTHPLPVRTAPLRIAMAWHPRTDNSPAHVWLRQLIVTLQNTEETT